MLPTVAAALALFVVAFEFLAFQLRSGNDPSLAGAQAAPRPVLTRKVLRTKVVTDVVPTLGKGGTTTAAPASVSSTPAPAPAPVVTSTS